MTAEAERIVRHADHEIEGAIAEARSAAACKREHVELVRESDGELIATIWSDGKVDLTWIGRRLA